eukprot:TRINITY_DN13316_c0_g1_i1.p5 TRINITY_DN13316_c0_g1~~TRINITY_DN13316_c0_g1_i1.p5  ORF type:complete len:100 (+),score=1.71 TRINITY_DN13316_c0_g1_i1:450-749(+)
MVPQTGARLWVRAVAAAGAGPPGACVWHRAEGGCGALPVRCPPFPIPFICHLYSSVQQCCPAGAAPGAMRPAPASSVPQTVGPLSAARCIPAAAPLWSA